MAYNDLWFIRNQQQVMWTSVIPQKMDLMGVPPLNSVKGLTWQPGIPSVLCVNGENAFIHLWRIGYSRFITRKRNFLAEKLFTAPSRCRNLSQQSEEARSVLQYLEEAIENAKRTHKVVSELLVNVQDQDEDNHNRLEAIDSHRAKILNPVYGGDSFEESKYITEFEKVSAICKFEMEKNTVWKQNFFGEENEKDFFGEENKEDFGEESEEYFFGEENQ